MPTVALSRATVEGPGPQCRAGRGDKVVNRERGPQAGHPGHNGHDGVRRRPNILLVVSDQERQRGWLPASVRLPWRERLMAEGIEFTRYFTHSSPCSPSRASLVTGRYLPGHGVIDNVIMPEHVELDPSMPDVGLAAARRRLPVLVHREMAPVAVRAPRHGGLRVRRLGRQRPALHGVGRHRRPLRSHHRLQRGAVAPGQRRSPTAADRARARGS